MNIRTVLGSMVAVAALLVPSARAASVAFSAGIEIRSAADFFDPLAPLGAWVDVAGHGRCWHPSRVEVDWRPYSEGSWVWTDAGWYWESEEPWAWACYHYGSWYQDPSYGWVWIPATDWAPAWVTWRYSDDYIGWAPCGPSLSILPPLAFVFVDVHRFHEPIRRHDVIVNNTTIINRTRVVNHFPRETRTINGVSRTIVTDPGPGIEPIKRVTKGDFAPRPIQTVAERTPKPDRLMHRSAEPAATETSKRREIHEPAGAQPQPQRREVKQAPVIETTPPSKTERRIQEPAGAEAPPPAAERRLPVKPKRDLPPPAVEHSDDKRIIKEPAGAQPTAPRPKPGVPIPDLPPQAVHRPAPPPAIERATPPAHEAMPRREPPAMPHPAPAPPPLRRDDNRPN